MTHQDADLCRRVEQVIEDRWERLREAGLTDSWQEYLASVLTQFDKARADDLDSFKSKLEVINYIIDGLFVLGALALIILTFDPSHPFPLFPYIHVYAFLSSFVHYIIYKGFRIFHTQKLLSAVVEEMVSNHPLYAAPGKAALMRALEKRVTQEIINKTTDEFKVNPYLTLKLEYRGKPVGDIIIRNIRDREYEVISVQGPDGEPRAEVRTESNSSSTDPSAEDELMEDIREDVMEDFRTNIYVNNEMFMQCKYLLLNIPGDEVEKTWQYNSIDDLKPHYSNENEHDKTLISPETEFMGHCSNLEAWYENDYDTRLLDMRLAFPLLKKLTEAGDPKARAAYKEEVARRLQTDNTAVFQYLIEQNYLSVFSPEELLTVMEGLSDEAINVIADRYGSTTAVQEKLILTQLRRNEISPRTFAQFTEQTCSSGDTVPFVSDPAPFLLDFFSAEHNDPREVTLRTIIVAGDISKSSVHQYLLSLVDENPDVIVDGPNPSDKIVVLRGSLKDIVNGNPPLKGKEAVFFIQTEPESPSLDARRNVSKIREETLQDSRMGMSLDLISDSLEVNYPGQNMAFFLILSTSSYAHLDPTVRAQAHLSFFTSSYNDLNRFVSASIHNPWQLLDFHRFNDSFPEIVLVRTAIGTCAYLSIADI